MANEPGPSRLKTTETSLEVVDALYELDGGRIDEIANHLDAAPSTIHRHLTTLRAHDYVTKRGDVYHLGLRFLTIGGYIQHNERGYQLAKDKVQQLALTTGERVQFITEEHGQRVYIHASVGEDAVQTDAHIGKRGPLHCSAAGKAILAALPRTRVEEIIDTRGLSRVTPNTITDRETLLEELQEIANRGVAFNKQESVMGLNAAGTAVKRPDGQVLGAISISGPAQRFKGDKLSEEIPNLLLGATNEIELNLKYSG
ncbi:IclR family transcriptional regulator [Halalkalicoccus sp. NIPERK01]|uniref:IclR family transcriptional regulator n=1 Tax=Halalkalicoccus sp. NIPERK01 TaxID=3053469 RepID=UPI00256EF17E|nr:IclR family transcriptional regulator [Halalkalicoccus sp. NIPERK01]MDL5363459.1 IclR family transcriptional regulator [Halalkalicoccus sp. NIPERK01]